MTWPPTPTELTREQRRLGEAGVEPWVPAGDDLTVGGCFVCFPKGTVGDGAPGERGWAAAVAWRPSGVVATATVAGASGAAYRPGLLALREGPLLEQAVRSLAVVPDVLLVNATGRDHPRRAGLAFHLGAVLDLPTVGVTDRTLLATGPPPDDAPGSSTPLVLDGEVVGCWLRSRRGARPVAVHAAWRTSPETALLVVLRSVSGARTPEPIRAARRLARRARAAATTILDRRDASDDR